MRGKPKRMPKSILERNNTRSIIKHNGVTNSQSSVDRGSLYSKESFTGTGTQSQCMTMNGSTRTPGETVSGANGPLQGHGETTPLTNTSATSKGRKSCSSKKLPIVLETFNCHGLKQSCDYVAHRLMSCDVACLSETWLRPSEKVLVDRLVHSCEAGGEKFSVFFKSSMCDTDLVYSGRPFGGLAMIVRKSEKFNCSEIKIDSDRLMAVALKDSLDNIIQVIVNVYMPFYNSSDKSCTEEFIKTLDFLQNVIDSYSGVASVKVVGDFNARLPNRQVLDRRWFRQRGFNPHSYVLYDFIVSNNMYAADMTFPQTVGYTYSCVTRNIFNWIDHVLCLERESESIQDCKIIESDGTNVSDHLAVRLEFELSCAVRGEISCTDSFLANAFIRQPDWTDADRNTVYASLLEKRLLDMPGIDMCDVSDIVELGQIVERRLSAITDAIHGATRESGCLCSKKFKPKPFWCPELSALKDRKRFWWSLWVSADRPRSGVLYDVHKYLKKRFRQVCRRNMYGGIHREVSTVNHLYKSGNLKKFWNRLKSLGRSRVNSKLKSDDFASFFAKTMSDSQGELSDFQRRIRELVEHKASGLQDRVSPPVLDISPFEIREKIKILNTGVSPGCDGVTADHLAHGLSDTLCAVLANVFSIILTYGIVPSSFKLSIIVPIIKKSTLNPDTVESFRPISLSSVFSKIIELIVFPSFKIHDTQFGFQEGKGTGFVLNLVNDATSCFVGGGSPVYLCSLDAQKCFDSIWHDGLLFKLIDLMPDSHWLFLHNWYKSSFAAIRWNSQLSYTFEISRGVRQGSILSPTLFNIFINDLMIMLDESDTGLRIFDQKVNSCAYADDITVFSSTVVGLQRLIDMCVDYSKTWRFKFGIKKTKTIVFGDQLLSSKPVWTLGSDDIESTDLIELLGVEMDSDCSYSSHVRNRVRKCRQCIYKYSTCGMSYPGLDNEVKSYLWKTVGVPTLLYGTEAIPLKNCDFRSLETAQATLVKNCFGLCKRSHHSRFLAALNLHKIEDVIVRNSVLFFNRVLNTESPLRNLQLSLLGHYMRTGSTVRNTLIARIVQAGVSPVIAGLCPTFNCKLRLNTTDGAVDTIRALLFSRPYTVSDHFLVKLLTRVF